jgi:hypothetical protein
MRLFILVFLYTVVPYAVFITGTIESFTEHETISITLIGVSWIMFYIQLRDKVSKSIGQIED